MNPLLKQFIQESKDFLQGISEKLLDLEKRPNDIGLITELFRLVHTLKGNSGLFEFPDMTKILHAGEDLLDAVRDGRLDYKADIADALLDAIDLISVQIDEIDQSGALSSRYVEASAEIAAQLRTYLPGQVHTAIEQAEVVHSASDDGEQITADKMQDLSELQRMAMWQASTQTALFYVRYTPEPECFFKGEDPFFLIRQVPGIIAGQLICSDQGLPADFDCYQSRLTYIAWTVAARHELIEHFRYVPEQISIHDVPRCHLIYPVGDKNGGPVYGDFIEEALQLIEASDWDALSVTVDVMLDISAAGLWLSSALRWAKLLMEEPDLNRSILEILIRSLAQLTPPVWSTEPVLDVAARDGQVPHESISIAAAGFDSTADHADSQQVDITTEEQAVIQKILLAQKHIINLPATPEWSTGRLLAAQATLNKLSVWLGLDLATTAIDDPGFVEIANEQIHRLQYLLVGDSELSGDDAIEATPVVQSNPVLVEKNNAQVTSVQAPQPAVADEVKLERRSEDSQQGKVLKVDQIKVDRLMDLIGEMVVAKNSLPYLANKAEEQFGVRELAKEIKSQYSVIDRIAEEMQDAIMQIRMMPVSFIFQRFPRLVRDLSRKLDKEVELILEGEETEADKNIIEALADPLIHIVRNSLDHGLETKEVRLAAGKPAAGRLSIRAAQESDRVIIEIIDDGKGIDPGVIKRKAYEKGLIDESQLERMSDKEAINLVFAAGFSTADKVSDLSGRGVGMDVVRSALENVGGTVNLFSNKGKGTTLRLALPLSMAVTNVMIIESDKQIFGIPMDLVVETVRLPKLAIQSIKQTQTTVLRDKVIPLLSLNALLALGSEPTLNEENEFAVLVVRIGSDQVGLIVDDFNEVVDVILKPLPGELSKISCYAGSALLGDGSVLMVLNPRGLL